MQAAETTSRQAIQIDPAYDLCRYCTQRPATKFVAVPQYGFGGDPAYGSFRGTSCEVCAEMLRAHPDFAGMRVEISDCLPRRMAG